MIGARHSPDLGMIVAEVSTRLRAGATVEAAWTLTLSRAGIADSADIDSNGVPAALRAMRKGWWLGKNRVVSLGVPPAVAVCRMSSLTGAPVAEVLDACAEGISEATEAAAARRAALAGPVTSARMLALLPGLGVLLGLAIGVDPLGFLLGTSMGKILLLLGAFIEVIGIAWVRAMVKRAEEA